MTVSILQARVSSSRMPGKGLLPVAGMPLAILAAERAMNRGIPLRVATSVDKTDDGFARLLALSKIDYVRGSLHDVLGRFVAATRDLPENTTVIRLTADNVFPDGAFIEELATELSLRGLIYLGTNSPEDGLPYGLSAEAFTIQALREAHEHATSDYDREHVTPWIRRNYPGSPFRPKSFLGDYSHLRCTVDCLADYERVAGIFESVDAPGRISWRDLCVRLDASGPHPRVVPQVKRGWRGGELTLGTAQLGIPSYGRANKTGRPELHEAVRIIREAIDHGVGCLDTARAYELAEQTVGEAIKPYGGAVQVVTKLSPLSDIPRGTGRAEIRYCVDASIFRSCRELGISHLPVVLLHRWEHRKSHNGRIWERLLELKSEGVIGVVGASVYGPLEAAEALADPEIRHLQIPFNLLDDRWLVAGIDRLAVQRDDVVIHARSILLQGILAAHPGVWPRVPDVSPETMVARLEEMAVRLGRESRLDLCLAFARAQPWIHSFVIGAETMVQLQELIGWFQRSPLTFSEVEEVASNLPNVPETLLNPSLWPNP